ncbi:MAG TPA: DNA alkylation repair protein [Candidatus Limnocylindria bacterium]|nr:DNA alkylation repair protein [Candidatus Limnocylindria bacterium]
MLTTPRMVTSKIPRRVVEGYHDEVVAALREIGNPRLGAAIAKDRGSSIEHLGIRFPALRKRVKQGFSFYDLPADRVLAIWDRLWRTSPYGDVLFAALEYYAPVVRKQVTPSLWPVVRHWHARVDNWCHSDGLSSLYSWILAGDPDAVYPQLRAWNRTEDQWLRRISLVSLIHYSGKNAVFVPLDRALPLVTTCLKDEREYVQKAVGWVLREMGHAHPEAVRVYIEEHLTAMSAVALRRAIERRGAGEKARLLALFASSSMPTKRSPR